MGCIPISLFVLSEAMNIALKHRPSSFKDLVGQDILVRVLENAFILNKIPQSILLSGSSGVGKTTTARIIALCLNCSWGQFLNLADHVKIV